MNIRPGDTVTATVSTTDGRTVTADVVAERVDRLGCGCQRITAVRPGPDLPGTCMQVALLTGCTRHENDVIAVNPTAAVAA